MTITLGKSSKQLQVSMDVQFPEALLELDKRLKKKLPGTMRRIAMEGKSFWKSEAGKRLRASRLAYQAGIDLQVVNELSFYLSLSGFIPFSVEAGNSGFDMKPGLLRNATKISPKVGRYRVIPLNLNHYVRMLKPTTFATVHEQSQGWKHPGWKGVGIALDVVDHLDTVVIPKHMTKLLGDL